MVTWLLGAVAAAQHLVGRLYCISLAWEKIKIPSMVCTECLSLLQYCKVESWAIINQGQSIGSFKEPSDLKKNKATGFLHKPLLAIWFFFFSPQEERAQAGSPTLWKILKGLATPTELAITVSLNSNYKWLNGNHLQGHFFDKNLIRILGTLG